MIFELSYYGYDGGNHWLFSHDDKTEEEFQIDCNELLVKYGDEYMASEEDSWVGSPGWMKHIVCKLPERGYEYVEPLRSTYSELSILHSHDREEWEPIVGKRLMDKAIDHNFVASLCKDSDIFIVDSIYHMRECQVLLSDRSENVWAFNWKDLPSLPNCTPCEVCKPQRP